METRTRIAAIIQDKKILMQRGTGYEELWTPSGKLEKNETEEEYLRRELKEEIGVNIINLDFLGEYQYTSFYNSEKIINEKVYIVSISGEPIPDAEIEEIIWLSRGDFETRKYPMIPITEEKIIPDLITKGLF